MVNKIACVVLQMHCGMLAPNVFKFEAVVS